MSNEKQSKIIPNSYQTPNYYADEIMQYLTAEEWKVLSYAMRRIFGFNARRANISISMFCDGFTTRDGEKIGGTGLGTNAVEKALDGLSEAGILVKVKGNDPSLNYGAEYTIQLDEEKVNINWLIEREQKKLEVNRQRTEKARFVRQNNVDFVGQNEGGVVGQNEGGIVGQKVKTQETQETHLQAIVEKANKTVDAILENERKAKGRQWSKLPEIFQPYARAFQDATGIEFSKREANDWLATISDWMSAGYQPSDIEKAAREIIREGRMAITRPGSITWKLRTTAAMTKPSAGAEILW